MHKGVGGEDRTRKNWAEYKLHETWFVDEKQKMWEGQRQPVKGAWKPNKGREEMQQETNRNWDSLVFLQDLKQREKFMV